MLHASAAISDPRSTPIGDASRTTFFGELYYRSTLPFLDAETTKKEVDYLARAFKRGDGPIVDLGCGHGRHAQPLASRVNRKVIGIDFDALSLEQARGFSRVRGDLLHLPLRDQSIGAAYFWYSTLFTFEREHHRPLLEQVHRVLCPGGLLLVQTIPIERLHAEPEARWDGDLPDGGHLTETSRFDPGEGSDHGHRTLRTPDGRVLSASYSIHYYPAEELVKLFESTGFSVKWLHGALDGGALGQHSRDLIVGAEKRNG